MKFISETIQKQLPENTRLEFINGEKDSYMDGRDELRKLEITFSNGFGIRVSTKNYGGIIVEELPKQIE